MFLLGDLVQVEVLARLILAALVWVLFQHLVRFHPRGIEIVGALLATLGFVWWVSDPRMFPPFGAILFLLGFAVHAIGRLLFRFRKHAQHSRKNRRG